MLTRLSKGEATVSELAQPLDISLPAVSKHLGVLERAGLIDRTAQAQWRKCTMRPQTLLEAEQWLEHMRTHWNSRLDALEQYLVDCGAREPEPEPKK